MGNVIYRIQHKYSKYIGGMAFNSLQEAMNGFEESGGDCDCDCIVEIDIETGKCMKYYDPLSGSM